ncbi:MAG TPA: glutathione S-transferase family protein [Allosphingosinicella sp.]|nr:glutathione S-transferase family protein [Allosphingosinicella sp.]
MMKVIGSYVSPYVRKVLACLALKHLAYEIDPITPFFGGEAFERLSPLRRIPVLIDGDSTLCDSSVICAYLDEAYPRRPLLPPDPKARARARWLEEYADTRLGDLFIWGLFYPKIVHPIVWGEPGDPARIGQTLEEGLPREMTISNGSCRPTAGCQAPRSASPTSPSRPSSATAPMPASLPIRSAGRESPLSSGGRSTMTASPACLRSSRPSSAPIRRAAARRCSPPARR